MFLCDGRCFLYHTRPFLCFVRTFLCNVLVFLCNVSMFLYNVLVFLYNVLAFLRIAHVFVRNALVFLCNERTLLGDGLMLQREARPGDYQLKAAHAMLRPPPEAHMTTTPPSFNFPSRTASSKTIGMQAEPV
ncbi:MAG: hypothetical protein QOJ76_621 [Acidobacteriota bacterium]|nr:hypothetical protein [Acidobacteriota bacterium]